jgi:hypothetical protein
MSSRAQRGILPGEWLDLTQARSLAALGMTAAALGMTAAALGVTPGAHTAGRPAIISRTRAAVSGAITLSTR